MRYIWQHIKAIIAAYNGSMPLAHYLKGYFREHPILGSRDRRVISAMAYSWYRCAKGIAANAGAQDIEGQIMACVALCDTGPHIIPAALAQEMPTPPPFNERALFPYDIPLSVGIDKDEWLRSMLTQPRLFIRIRKDRDRIIKLLQQQEIPFETITDTCLSLPNGAKIDALLPPESYVVQDASSQQTGTYFHPQKGQCWYDCCSGAGGKSLLLKDMAPAMDLTVSDRRDSIIHNLRQRFQLYRHMLPHTHIVDTSDSQQLAAALKDARFDDIICDAPCSGSGTWARTPEQLYFFDPGAVQRYAALQLAIATHVAHYLKPGGRLIYITCSVFKEENEDVVAGIVQATGMQAEQMQLINGISIKADSMFVAVLKAAPRPSPKEREM